MNQMCRTFFVVRSKQSQYSEVCIIIKMAQFYLSVDMSSVRHVSLDRLSEALVGFVKSTFLDKTPTGRQHLKVRRDADNPALWLCETQDKSGRIMSSLRERSAALFDGVQHVVNVVLDDAEESIPVHVAASIERPDCRNATRESVDAAESDDGGSKKSVAESLQMQNNNIQRSVSELREVMSAYILERRRATVPGEGMCACPFEPSHHVRASDMQQHLEVAHLNDCLALVAGFALHSFPTHDAAKIESAASERIPPAASAGGVSSRKRSRSLSSSSSSKSASSRSTSRSTSRSVSTARQARISTTSADGSTLPDHVVGFPAAMRAPPKSRVSAPLPPFPSCRTLHVTIRGQPLRYAGKDIVEVLKREMRLEANEILAVQLGGQQKPFAFVEVATPELARNILNELFGKQVPLCGGNDATSLSFSWSKFNVLNEVPKDTTAVGSSASFPGAAQGPAFPPSFSSGGLHAPPPPPPPPPSAPQEQTGVRVPTYAQHQEYRQHHPVPPLGSLTAVPPLQPQGHAALHHHPLPVTVGAPSSMHIRPVHAAHPLGGVPPLGSLSSVPPLGHMYHQNQPQAPESVDAPTPQQARVPPPQSAQHKPTYAMSSCAVVTTVGSDVPERVLFQELAVFGRIVMMTAVKPNRVVVEFSEGAATERFFSAFHSQESSLRGLLSGALPGVAG